MRVGRVTVLIVVVMAAAGWSCAPDRDSAARLDSQVAELPSSVDQGPDSLAFGDGGVDDEKPSPTLTTGSVTDFTRNSAASELSSPNTTTSTVAAEPSTTAGSGAAPATTIRSGAGADVTIYQGVLGGLDRNAVVVQARTAPPPVVPGVMPLTGLPGEVPQRPAAVVKIDNGGPARPQTGLNSADIVIEEEVEGGVTRFAAVFHSTASIVGPVRSARTTDIGIINGFGSPLLLYSGANAVTDTLIRAQPTVQNRSAATSSGYWRRSSRRAPSNLYSDTAPHWATASGGPPPPQFVYRSEGEPVGGVDDSGLTIAYRASHAGWAWDGSRWLRTQGGRAHMTDGAGQVSAANVVVIETDEVATGLVDSSGATVPEFVFVGEGRATVFTAGRRIEGVWNRPSLADVATLTTGDGAVIKLSPGRTWVELIRSGGQMLR